MGDPDLDQRTIDGPAADVDTLLRGVTGRRAGLAVWSKKSRAILMQYSRVIKNPRPGRATLPKEHWKCPSMQWIICGNFSHINLFLKVRHRKCAFLDAVGIP